MNLTVNCVPDCLSACLSVSRGWCVPGLVLSVAAGLAQQVDVIWERGDSRRSVSPEQLGALLHPHPRPAGRRRHSPVPTCHRSPLHTQETVTGLIVRNG